MCEAYSKSKIQTLEACLKFVQKLRHFEFQPLTKFQIHFILDV